MAGTAKGKSTEDFPPLPGKPDIGQASPSPAAQSTQDVLMQQILIMQKQQGELLEMQRQQAEEHRLLRDELQRQAQINVELEAKVAAKPGTSDPDAVAKTAEQLLERRRKLEYVPAASINPFPPRPATLTSRMPQLYDLHGSKTYDALSKKSNFSMKYECMVLAPALSYLHDVVNECNETLDVNEDCGLSKSEWQKRFHAVTNSVHGVYALLCNRWTMLELRGQLEQEPGSSQRGGSDALRAKLQFVEDRVYQAADGVVADEVLQQWLNDFDKNRGKAMLSLTAKNAANAEPRVVNPRDRDQRWKDRKKYEEKDGKKPTEKGGKGRAESPRPMCDVRAATPSSATALSGRWAGKTHRATAGETAEGSMARGGRQFRGDAMDYSRGEVEVEARASASVRPRGVTEGCYAAAAGVVGRGEGEAATERCLDESDEKISCFSRFFSAETGYEQVETGGGLPMAEPVVCEKSREDGDAEETKETGETGRLVLQLRPPGRFSCAWDPSGLSTIHAVRPARGPASMFSDAVRMERRSAGVLQVLRQRWSVRRRTGGAGGDANRHSGMRVLPYMDDFLVLVDSQREGFLRREKVQLVLHRLGLRRNEKKGQWEPTQVVEHLGLEVDLKLGQFRVTERRVHKIHTKAKEILCDAARNPRETQLGSKGKNLACSSGGLRMVVQAACDEQVERAQDLKIPDESEDEMRNWHITYLELEAVYKTVQAFLLELEGKVVRLYCDNQAVVAMLSHFTSINSDLMRRMRRLWLLLDLHDIELQARYIRSEANVWADNLSRCEDLDDWRLNRDWFVWANKQWGPYTVDRFASEISAQLPRYYAAWKDPKCEGVDSLTYDWRGENNWVNPPWALLDEVAHKLREEGAAATVVAPYWPGQSWFRELEALATEVVIMPRYYAAEVRRSSASCTTAAEVTVGSKIEVFWKDDDCFYPGVVKEFNEDGKAHVLYDDGDEETLDLSEENFKIINNVSELTDEATDADGENIERISGGDYEEYKRGGAVQNFLTRSLCERWRAPTAVAASIGGDGVAVHRLSVEGRGIKSASLQPYLSAINNYHEDLRFPRPAKGRSVTRAVKGMATILAELAVQEENIETQRTWLPAAHVRRVHEAALSLTPRSPEELQLLRAFTYVVVAFVTFGRPDTGTSLSRQHVHCGDSEFSVVLLKEKGRRHQPVKRRLCIPWKGVALLKELIEHWEFHRDTAWNSSEKTQPDAYWLLPEDPKNFKASVANDWIGLALSELDCKPPEGGHFSAHSTRKGATTCARAVGVAMEKVCFFGGWSQFSLAVQHYIDPTALRDTDLDYYFAWLTWSQ
ncbi:hypothetical protein CYMTET_41974 [Cymbomonas tetramitiformis]|uniref:Tudor domain-containing protein n=2 Tax=Cymbomonas tetramitiformis TaxID=36881 RepID=A0AAE0C518_9CHLO|nr:hypothetical protein CYMTET_41974 [Cymbomonas tetramitiformis]